MKLFYISILAEISFGIAILELGFYQDARCTSRPRLLALEPLLTSNFNEDSCQKTQASVYCEKQDSYVTAPSPSSSYYFNVSCIDSGAYNTSTAYFARFKRAFQKSTPFIAFTAFNDSKCHKVLLGEAVIADGSCVTISNHQSNQAIVTPSAVILKSFQESQNCSGQSIDTRIPQSFYNGSVTCGVVDGLYISAVLDNSGR